MAKGAITVKIDGQYDNKDINRAIKDLNALKTQAGGTGDGMSALSKGFIAAGAAMVSAFSISAVTDFLTSSMQAAIEDEKSMVALATAMQNVGVGPQTAAVEDFVKQLSLATGVADDQLRPAFQKLVTATGDVTTAQDLLQTSMDISAATGKDLASVSLAMAKASTGNIGALTRLGVPLDANIVKAKDFAGAVDVLNKKFGGQAAAAADTYGGQLLRLQTAADEAKETIGYALLNALDDASNAFGGSGGMVDAISAAGQKLADFITGIGIGTSALADFLAAADDMRLGTDEVGFSLLDVGKSALLSVPAIGAIAGALGLVTEAGAESSAASKSGMDVWNAMSGVATALATKYGFLNAKTGEVVTESERAAAAIEDIKDSFQRLNTVLGTQDKVDAYKAAILGIKDAIDKTSRSLDDNSLAGLKNRDAVRTLFTDAQAAAEAWGTKNGKTTEEVQTKFATMTKNIRAKLIAEGFTAKDVDAYLGGTGLWNAQVQALANGLTRGQAASGLRYAGMALGKNLNLGIIAGLESSAAAVRTAGASAAANAAAGARYAAQVSSPSRVWAVIGSQMMEGLDKGITDSTPKSVAAAVKAVSALAGAVTGTLPGLIDSARTEVNASLDKARTDVESWVGTMRDALLSGFDIGTAYTAALAADGALSAQAWVDGVRKQVTDMQAFGNILQGVKDAGGSQALVDYLASKGVESGAAMGTAMLTEGLVPTMSAAMAEVQAQATATAQSMVPSFLQSGLDSAQATVTSFNAMFGPGGAGHTALQTLMTQLAESMRRTTQIDINVVRNVSEIVSRVAGSIAGVRAAGGPVTGGLPYLVGEGGPELFVPTSSGDIIPNGSGSSGGRATAGTTYQITVQAGVGDPRAIGQTVVEYIKRFESANGPVFVAA